MLNGRTPVPSTAADLLQRRGIALRELAEVVLALQQPYNEHLDLTGCMESLEQVLRKREVQYAVITGVTLDEMAERGDLDEPLGSIVREDGPLYGIDTILALSIVNIYGTIGLSNYGYLALQPPEFLRRWQSREGRVHTFLNDIVAAVVAATCARIAHRAGQGEAPVSQGGEPVA